MQNRLYHSVVSGLALMASACGSDRDPTAVLRPETIQQDQAGSSAAVSGLAYVVGITRTDVPGSADPLLRPTINVTAKLRNDRSDSVVVTYGPCNIGLDAYRSSDRRGTPVWSSFSAQPWEGTFGRACAAIALQKKLGPGDELTFGYSSRVIEILGDSLPNGRYYLSATVYSGPAGAVALPAGEMELDLARPPLPESRTHALIDYAATSAVSTGQNATVNATVRATLTHAGGSSVQYRRDCPIELVAYRARERRDSAPRSGAPDWQSNQTCSAVWNHVILDRGESTSLATIATAREILGTALPEGLYHFAIVVHTPTRDLWLSAGSGELRR